MEVVEVYFKVNGYFRKFPGGEAFRTRLPLRGNPSQGAKIPQAMWCGEKQNKIKLMVILVIGICALKITWNRLDSNKDKKIVCHD